MVLSLEFMATCFLYFFLINFIMYLPSLFFNSMHCSGCSALSGVSPNWKKKLHEFLSDTIKEWFYLIEAIFFQNCFEVSS